MEQNLIETHVFRAAGVVAADVPSAPVSLRTAEGHTRKPSLPISIATVLPVQITAGENLTLDVDVSSSLEQGQLVVTFVPDEGLALISPQQELQFDLSSGGVFKTSIPLTVLPARDGRYAVTVDIRHVVDGRSRGVVRGITFRVGDEPVAAKARATTSAGNADGNVISLPAQETIIR